VAITANAWWRTTASQRARSSDAEGGEVVGLCSKRVVEVNFYAYLFSLENL
jgi:hypothetical protein